ncbi:MAG: cell division protein FtsL [Acetivibrionales bacterium]|jgi:cell division protein FtsL|nr:cell division protein FtsL [Clostridiaceae bacterium]
MARNNSYIYGSAAPQLPKQPENPVKERRVVRQVPGAVPKKAPRSKSKLLFCLMFIVSVCFVVLYRFCCISEMNTQMGALKAEYDELRDENRKLNVEIETGIDLDRVKEIAEVQLNMHAPDQNQLVLVNVPKSDYSVVMDYDYIDGNARKTSPLEKLISAAREILQ